MKENQFKKEDRLNAIIDILQREGKVSNHNLLQRFHVTDMTIRRDLDTLARDGKIVRVHGGAVLPNKGKDMADTPARMEPSYLTRMAEHDTGKQEIAQLALKLIQPSQCIFLDSGTSTLHVAQLIPADFPCTIITNGVNIATELLAHKFPRVILIGGDIDPNTWSTRGSLCEAQIGQFHADIAFMGCNAVSPEGNIMIGNIAENDIKQKIVSISRELYLLVDAAKFNNYSLMSYASLSDFDGIITDSSLPQNVYNQMLALNNKIITPQTK